MINSSLCYIENDGAYLMLHRTKKTSDPNEGKWIGIGGKFEEGESPDECAIREVKEETGIALERVSYRGIVTFTSDVWETEYMHLFTAKTDARDVCVCDEGELEWKDISSIPSLNIWEGDRIFLDLLAANAPHFSLKLEYKGERLVGAVLNGKRYPL
ncbi:MAG: 8-oxo-dGTP diphosphatase [Clostridia bacterium]|nr:8-oxo-dGTP diphosphatase [Clostridia bacterium]